MIGLRFLPLKSADIRGEQTSVARLRMSAGEATNKQDASRRLFSRLFKGSERWFEFLVKIYGK